jgi:hypothetical protein
MFLSPAIWATAAANSVFGSFFKSILSPFDSIKKGAFVSPRVLTLQIIMVKLYQKIYNNCVFSAAIKTNDIIVGEYVKNMCCGEIERSGKMPDLSVNQKQKIDEFLRKTTATSIVLFLNSDGGVVGKRIGRSNYQEIYWWDLNDAYGIKIGIDVPFSISMIKEAYLHDLVVNDIQQEETDPVLMKLRQFREEQILRLLLYSLNDPPLSKIELLGHLRRYGCDDAFDVISLMIKNTENGFPGYLQHKEGISEETYQNEVIIKLRELNLLP